MILVGAAAFFLSKETQNEEFDPKIHTLEKLREIMEDLYLEYSTGYVYYHYLLLDYLEQPAANRLEAISKVQRQAKDYTSSRDSIVCKKYGISVNVLPSYIQHYSKDR